MARCFRVIACKGCGEMYVAEQDTEYICDDCKNKTQENDKLNSFAEIIERIMSAHWDIVSCNCWVCKKGRELGLKPRDFYLAHKEDNRKNYPVPALGWVYKPEKQ
jgi:hypothetical protein